MLLSRQAHNERGRGHAIGIEAVALHAIGHEVEHRRYAPSIGAIDRSARAGRGSGRSRKQSQNPVAAIISQPFQNDTFFGIGPDDDVANVLNIQPVIPINLGPVNLINRTIVPLIYLPDLTSGLGKRAGGNGGGVGQEHPPPVG